MVAMSRSVDTSVSEGTYAKDSRIRGVRDRDRYVNYYVDGDKIIRHRPRILQLQAKLIDSDMPYHCHRVYFYGHNHPFSGRGGPWKVDVVRPTSLRPMLDSQEYYNFAREINDRVRWPLLGWEVLLFLFVSIFFPPFAPYLLYRLRKRRGQKLLEYIISYDHKCFRHPLQRKQRNSVRVGISPCYTLASIDFLYEYEDAPKTDEQNGITAMNALCRPLAPIGQSKLPAVFRLAGFGTFFTPFGVDTNDILLQTIPQTDVPTKFIVRPWIDFVAELNNRLRTIQPSGLRFGLRKIIMFLDKVNASKELGGIFVEIVTMANFVPVESDANKERRKQARQLRMSCDDVGGRDDRASSLGVDSNAESSRGSEVGHHFRKNTTVSAANNVNEHSKSGDYFANLNFDRIPEETRESTQKYGEVRRKQSIRQSWFQTVDGNRNSVASNLLYHTNLNAGTHQKSSRKKERQDSQDSQEGQDGQDGQNNKGGAKKITILKSLQECYSAAEGWHQRVLPIEQGGSLGELNFDETCALIASGRLSLGLRVTAPKVAKQVRVLCDDDYLSDDEVLTYLEALKSKEEGERDLENDAGTKNTNKTVVNQEVESKLGSRRATAPPRAPRRCGY